MMMNSMIPTPFGAAPITGAHIRVQGSSLRVAFGFRVGGSLRRR